MNAEQKLESFITKKMKMRLCKTMKVNNVLFLNSLTDSLITRFTL